MSPSEGDPGSMQHSRPATEGNRRVLASASPSRSPSYLVMPCVTACGCRRSDGGPISMTSALGDRAARGPASFEFPPPLETLTLEPRAIAVFFRRLRTSKKQGQAMGEGNSKRRCGSSLAARGSKRIPHVRRYSLATPRKIGPETSLESLALEESGSPFPGHGSCRGSDRSGPRYSAFDPAVWAGSPPV